MAKYRKKPVVVEAVQWDGSKKSAQAINKFNGGQLWTIKTDNRRMYVPSPEGGIWASPGDWIIKGVQGEFYSCNPDIFESTYEPIEDAGN